MVAGEARLFDSMNYDAAAVVDKGEWMGAFWMVCILEGGVWVPRQDLEPSFNQAAAESFARDQTVKSERLHKAFPGFIITEQTKMTEQVHEARAFSSQPDKP